MKHKKDYNLFIFKTLKYIYSKDEIQKVYIGKAFLKSPFFFLTLRDKDERSEREYKHCCTKDNGFHSIYPKYTFIFGIYTFLFDE